MLKTVLVRFSKAIFALFQKDCMHQKLGHKFINYNITSEIKTKFDIVFFGKKEIAGGNGFKTVYDINSC